MNHGEFQFSKADDFNPNFSFSSTTNASQSEYGKFRPRLTKLRKPKSSSLQQGAAGLTYNPFRSDAAASATVFGWSSFISGAKEWVPTHASANGKPFHKSGVPHFSVPTTSPDETSTAKLQNEFEKLNGIENAASVSGGIPSTCGNFSLFEFRSSKNGDSHHNHSSMGRSSGVLPDLLRKLNLEDSATDVKGTHDSDNFVSGSTEAILSKRMEHCVQDRVGDSNSGAARETCSYNNNIKNGTYHVNKENMFFQEAAVANPTAFLTTMPPKNGGLSSPSAPTSTSSATNNCYQHETNFTHETFANRHAGEGFCFTGKFDRAMSPNIKPSFNRKVKLVPKRHAMLQKRRKNVKLNMESRVDPASYGKDSATKEFSSRPKSPQPYSPMDMTPNPVTEAQCSNEASKTSDETFTQRGKFESSERNTQDGNHHPDVELAYATQQLNIGKNVSGTHIDDTQGCAFESVRKIPPKEFASETETESFKSATEDFEFNTENTTSTAREKCSSCNSESDGTTKFYSVCNSEATSGTKFTFTASSSSVKPTSVRHFKAIHRSKGSNSFRYTAKSKGFNELSGGQHLKDTFQDNIKANLTGSQLKPQMESSTRVREEANHEPSGALAATTVAQEACEKWRLRGNQAYENGDLSKAEEFYTRGVKCAPKSEKSRGCSRSLMLCYSNRAATHMSLGRLREAVKDCKLAARIDPSFLRAHVRAANCYLALGEIEEASMYFKYCLHPGTGVSADRKIFKEATEGLQKAQKADKGISQSIEIIRQGTWNDAEDALRSADEALTICLYSEKLLEIKAEALFMLQKYNKVIQLCRESLDSAERNSNTTGDNGRYENPNSASLHGRLYYRLWRCRLMLKSYFFLGKLDEALALLEKHESLRKGSETLESCIPFVASIRELLQYKAAGNEAFQSGNYAEAIEHYTAALAFNIDSLPFAAICFCNRAAAYKAQGKVIDSIADCNLAIALERDYLKAILRRASLYESIRDYGQAARDTGIIVSLLKEQADINHKKSQEKSTNSGIPIDLRQAQLQLSRLEEQAKKDTPLNMYLILDVKSSACASDIKKAYRQAALKHHPDKAGQVLAKGDSRRNGTWKRIAEDIHRDADRLFKLIGEAYTVLSDPAQRSGYDAEEEIRNMLKKNREPFTSRTHFDAHNYPFHRSRSRRQSNNIWRSHGNF